MANTQLCFTINMFDPPMFSSKTDKNSPTRCLNQSGCHLPEFGSGKWPCRKSDLRYTSYAG